MIEKNIGNASAQKNQLLKLSIKEIRLEAKKLSIHLYSRKTKKELIELLLRNQKRLLIENKTNNDALTVEERIALEKAKANEYITSDKNKSLKRLLSKLFPNKKITVTDNKDGS